MNHLAVIPARSGSKGLPGKNIRMLCGKPLLAYSVEAALQSKMFGAVHVSTDSTEYAGIARAFGADVPFLRSAANSSDTASSWDVVREVLERYSETGKVFDTVMLLQPTSPLRTAADITAAFALMKEKQADTVVSVCRAEVSPKCCHVLPKDGSMADFARETDRRRQDMGIYYRLNGAIFLAKATLLQRGGNLYGSSCFAYVMEKERSVDIDDELDFLLAEAVLKREKGSDAAGRALL